MSDPADRELAAPAEANGAVLITSDHDLLSHRDQLNLIQGSYLDLPLGEGMYDFAVAVMTLHHLLPERKRELYERIRSALKVDGVYVEGDWVVSAAEERRYLRAYEERMVEWPDAGDGRYHIDVPLSLGRQRQLLLSAGFSSVDVIWQAQGNGVYVAGRESASCDQAMRTLSDGDLIGVVR